MAENVNVYDGSDIFYALDSDTHPSLLPNTFVWESVNRIYRGGVNRTRPGFREIKWKAESQSILDRFIYGNFQGAYAYRAVKPESQDGIVCSVGGIIYFITFEQGFANIHQIATNNDSNLMHTWFVQAEDWLYVQNGYQNPIAWDGVIGHAGFRLNPALNQMPIGTIMEYAHGRVFVSDAQDNIYASDIIFGNGTTTTSNTQNFTEQTYWAEGGSFSTPANMGRITGMKVMPSLNINDRGQGELVVFCERGAYTLNVQIPREEWQDAQIQKISLTGRGCRSPWSITPVNNEVFFRSDDGWSLYSNSQIDFTQRLGFRKFTREVNRWTNQDTDWLKQFASGIVYDNRFIGTVSPYTVPPRTGNQSFGLHRPHRGMIVLDLDLASAPAPDASLNFRWNGLWIGPQPTQLIKAYIDGEERAFAFSFDADGKNRLFEFTKDSVDDWARDENVKIRSYFTTKRYDFSGSEQTNRFYRKQLSGGEIWVSECKERSVIFTEYRPDSYPCWEPLSGPIAVGCDDCGKVIEDCIIPYSWSRYRRIKFPTPIKKCQQGSKIRTDEGAEFQVRVNIEGSVTIDRLRLYAETRGNVETPTGDCPNQEPNCEPIQCCPLNGWDYYRIIDPAAAPSGPGGTIREPEVEPEPPHVPPSTIVNDLWLSWKFNEDAWEEINEVMVPPPEGWELVKACLRFVWVFVENGNVTEWQTYGGEQTQQHLSIAETAPLVEGDNYVAIEYYGIRQRNMNPPPNRTFISSSDSYILYMNTGGI